MRRFLTTPDGQVKPTSFSEIAVADLPSSVLLGGVTNNLGGNTSFARSGGSVQMTSTLFGIQWVGSNASGFTVGNDFVSIFSGPAGEELISIAPGILTLLPGTGTTGDVLRLQLGGGVGWETPVVDPGTTIGDMTYLSSITPNVYARLGIGSNGQVLTVSGGLPSWATPSAGFSDPMTTAGDIIIRNAGNTTTRLAVGTSTQVLKGGTAPSWGAVILTSDVSGTLPIANGGTNGTSFVSTLIPYFNGTSIASTGSSATGQGVVWDNTTGLFNSRRSAVTTASGLGVLVMTAISTADMADGHGALLSTSIRDNANVDNFIGNLGFIRNGADNSGMFRLNTTLAGNNSGAGTTHFNLSAAGNVAIGQGTTAGTARLHLPAGTATASTAPLKFTSGTVLTTAEAGAVEFLTDKWFATITTGAARKELTLNDAALTSGTFPVATTNGRLTDSAFTSTNLTSGTYTPTLSNTTNVAASTAYVTGYYRIGNSVTVYGKVDIDATAAAGTDTLLGMSLPIASNLAAEQDAGGTAVSNILDGVSVRIIADATNDRVSFVYKATSTSNDSFSFQFSYQVK